MKYLYTIQAKDINKKYITVATCNCTDCDFCGKAKRISIEDAIGRVLPIDIGKRVFISVSGSLHVENKEQMNKRISWYEKYPKVCRKDFQVHYTCNSYILYVGVDSEFFIWLDDGICASLYKTWLLTNII